MKVGLIIGGHQFTGGVFHFETTVLRGLRDHLADSGHTFFVLTAPPGFDTNAYTAEHLRFLDCLPSPPTSVLKRVRNRSVRVARNMLGQTGPRSWHLDMPGIRNGIIDNAIEVLYYLAPWPFEFDLPSILTLYDLQHRLLPEFPEVSGDGRWRAREQMYSNLIPRASTVITITEESKREVTELYQVRPDRIKVLPMVPATTFSADAPTDDSADIWLKYRIPRGYLFYPANFWPHKNHVGLLLAVQLLREQHDITIPVVLTGADKGNERYIRQVAEDLGLAEQVHFLGFVPDNDMSALYRNALALAMVSFFGPANIPPLEAFALGCPVINSDFRGAEEHISDAGLLVDPRDPSSIATAIKTLHEDKALRQRLIDCGLSRSSVWTMRDYCDGVLSILDDVAPLRRCWSNTEPYALPAPPRAR